MSRVESPPADTLTEDERELFERLSDEYEGEPLGRVFELALQASSERENREANS
ncbi:kinesin [Halogeometricum borinquense]|uniref:Kinesin n=1 Tax=Halogeometricum borinquense TaxID=60847 RepID=A0A482TMK8_9EURY|nr:kinesin [Halogeometricum borinquense]QIB73522.1 kinesin [Halogeometricum borinquense]RYJ13229.1 kinesin [Halogeometricum borinquense]